MLDEGNMSTEHWYTDNDIGEEEALGGNTCISAALSAWLGLRLKSGLEDEMPANYLPLT